MSPQKRRAPGNQLWKWASDVHLAVLAFLELESLAELARSCTGLREAGFVQVDNRWRLITPHLQLTYRCFDSCVDSVWLPNTQWLEARDLKAKSCSRLFSFFELTPSRQAKALVSLDLRNTKLSAEAALVNVVRTCASLRYLDLSRTRLRDHGGGQLLRGLVCDPHSGDFAPHRCLRHLVLEENGFSEAIAEDIASAALHTPLHTLLLKRNEIGDAGAIAIAESLAVGGGFYPGEIAKLDVSENQLTAIGLAALLQAAAKNDSVKVLDVGGNDRIGRTLMETAEIAEDVTAALDEVSALSDLHLWRCGLNDPACQLIVDAYPSTITLLNLAANPFSQELRNWLMRSHAYRATAALRL